MNSPVSSHLLCFLLLHFSSSSHCTLLLVFASSIASILYCIGNIKQCKNVQVKHSKGDQRDQGGQRVYIFISAFPLKGLNPAPGGQQTQHWSYRVVKGGALAFHSHTAVTTSLKYYVSRWFSVLQNNTLPLCSACVCISINVCQSRRP